MTQKTVRIVYISFQLEDLHSEFLVDQKEMEERHSLVFKKVCKIELCFIIKFSV